MALGYNETLRHNQLDEIGSLIDAGSSTGVLILYSGSRPATGGAATTEVATLTFSATSMGSPSSGSVSANAIGDDEDATGGTATWFRVASSNDGAAPLNQVIDGDVGTEGSDLNLNAVEISAGSTVSVTSFQITAGNA